jgi:xylan 1,4-beta-xylosidase
LTHRHLGKDFPIQAVGHCDFVQTQNNEWWAVLLAIRPFEGKNLLGRETYMVPMTFENGWPVFNKGIGKVLFEHQRPDLPWSPFEQEPERDEFDDDKLALKWTFLRTPTEKWYELKNGKLIIDTRPQMVTKKQQPSLLVQRIRGFNFDALTKVDFKSGAGEEAGLVAVYNDQRNFRLVKTAEGNEQVVKLYKMEQGDESLVASIKVDHKPLLLGLQARGLSYQFVYGTSENDLKPIAGVQDAAVNASQSGIDFTGPMIGMYTSSNGKVSKNKAVFDWFEYKDK